jgi:hypothetical protein
LKDSAEGFNWSPGVGVGEKKRKRCEEGRGIASVVEGGLVGMVDRWSVSVYVG